MKKFSLTMVALSALLLVACKQDDVPKPKGVAYNLKQGSKIEWTGKAANGHNNSGLIDVEGQKNAEGFDFDVLNNEINGGEFTVPVSSINVTNLPPELKPVLEAHLKTADFFYMVLHPKVTFRIKSGKPTNNAGAQWNYLIKGEMTLLGNTHPLEFPAQVKIEGKVFSIKAAFSFNQSIWGMNYHLDPSYPEADRILPGVEIKLDLIAEAKQ